MIRIIGIGSPFGDDACGLAAARRLAEEPPAGAEVVVADRPGAALIELLDGVDATILIDAVRSGSPPGTLHSADSRRAAGCSASKPPAPGPPTAVPRSKMPFPRS